MNSEGETGIVSCGVMSGQYMTTLKFIFKALLVFWPFLRYAIFRDRTVSEVVKENWHMNGMLAVILVLVMFIFYLLQVTIDTKVQLSRVEAVMKTQPVCLSPEANDERRRRLMDLLK